MKDNVTVKQRVSEPIRRRKTGHWDKAKLLVSWPFVIKKLNRQVSGMFKLLSFIVSFCLISSLEARNIANTQAPPITLSLPTLGAPFVANFFLPEDYTIIQSNEKNPHDYYLGPKTLKDLSPENIRNQNKPLIHVLAVNGSKSFTDYIDDLVPGTIGLIQRTFEFSTPQWGRFPLIATKMSIGGDQVYAAHLALNDRSGNVLLFHLVIPRKLPIGSGNRPTPDELTFWNNFLMRTRV